MQPTDPARSKSFVPPAFSSKQITLDSRRVAVLPLQNISPDSKEEYFVDGLTEELISTLSKVRELSVISSTSAMQYKTRSKAVVEIGRELNAGTILEGSVRKAGSKVRITVQMIDAIHDKHLWAESYDRELQDIFAIQSDIAERVAEALKVNLLSSEVSALERRPTASMAAYTSYLQGRYDLYRFRDLRNALAHFEKAVREDPGFAAAYASIGACYMVRGDHYLKPSEAYPKAKEYCEKALRLDDSLVEAHSTLGFTIFQYYWDWPAAERELRRAIELNANDPWAQAYYALYLVCMGRQGEGVARTERVLDLDPLWLIAKAALGRVFYFGREYERATEQLRRVLELEPDVVWALSWFAYSLIMQNKLEEATSELEARRSLALSEPELVAILGYSYAASGNKERALDMLAKLQGEWTERYVSPSLLALVYLGLNDKDNLFSWLGKSYDERSAYLPLDIPIKVDPIWDSIKSDERFVSILRKMKLS